MTNRLNPKPTPELSDPKTPKRVYTTPQIQLFGSVRQFTQGTMGTNGDGSGLMNMSSSLAYKTSVTRIGTHPLGIGLYLFDYKPEFQKFGQGRQFGVMAEEVREILPEAVIECSDGYTRVNYAMLGVELADRPAIN